MIRETLLALPPMPNPVTKEWLAEAAEKGLLLIKDLKDGKYYAGHCRNARVAKWNADKQKFTYMRTKFGVLFPEDINHPEHDDGFDVFVPVLEVEPLGDEIVP